jgi:hypothetical protein
LGEQTVALIQILKRKKNILLYRFSERAQLTVEAATQTKAKCELWYLLLITSWGWGGGAFPRAREEKLFTLTQCVLDNGSSDLHTTAAQILGVHLVLDGILRMLIQVRKDDVHEATLKIGQEVHRARRC